MAVIIGNVEIGDETSVWPGAIILGDLGKITIGKQCSFEDNCVIHSGMPGKESSPVTIGNRGTVGHCAVIQSLLVGRHILIGMNSTQLRGSIIGGYCIIAAQTLVGEGK